MAGDFNVAITHGIVDKLVLRAVPALENFLDNVISVDVFAHFFEKALKLILNHYVMFWESNYFN